MKQRLLRITAIPALMALLVFGGAIAVQQSSPAEALTNCTASSSIESEEQAFLGLINNYRAQNGRPALAISTGLTRMATWHGSDMASNNYFSHTDSLGRSFGTRLGQCDAAGGGAAENIAAGYQTAAQVFEGWRNSPGHNTNMLNANYRYIGISRVTGGSYGVYWVTDFSTINPSAGGTTPATSTATSTPTRTSTPRTSTPVSTSTAVPTATAPAATKAAMTSPTNGSFIGRTTTFSWSAAAGADEYMLYVGTTPGANNVYSASLGLNRSTSVSNLPSFSTVYVRLWTRDGSAWQYNDYTYRRFF